MSDELAEGRELYTFVVVGKAILKSGKVAWTVSEVLDGDVLGDQRHYQKARDLNLHVGGVYTVERESGSHTIYPGTCAYQRSWPNERERLQWDIAARAFDLERDAERAHADDKKRNLVRESLAPIREVYVSTNVQGRRAIEVLVLEYLRSGS